MDSRNNSAVFAKLFPQPLRKGERAKLRIVDAAVKIIGDEGIEALGYESIGKALKLPRAQVRYHFPDKEELVAKAIEFAFLPMQDIMLKRLDATKSWMDWILALSDTLFDFIDEYPTEARVWVYAHTAAALHSKHRDTMRHALASGERRITAILHSADPKHAKWSKKDLQTLSLGVWSIIDAFSIYAISLQPEDRNRYRRESKNNLLRLFGNKSRQ